MKQLILIPLFFIFLISCSDEKQSPENEIRQYIESGKLAAENRSYRDLAELISEQYKDQKGLDKKRISNMARAYFLMHQNIYLLTKINSIDFQDDNSVFVVLHVAMAGTEITNLNIISQLRARVYKFELQLIKKDSWLLTQAKWKSADIQDML